MKINDVYREICENPHDDEPRLLFAKLIEPAEPKWARFIRREIDATIRLRADDRPDTYSTPPEAERWVSTLLPLVAHGRMSGVEFHRGFPTLVRMHPGVFAEYGEQIFRLAPIRHIDFVPPYDEDGQRIVDARGDDALFPIDQVLACPALARLESIGFDHLRLPRDWTKQIVACPYLDNCMLLSLHRSHHHHEDIVAILESPTIRGMIQIFSELIGGSDGNVKLGLQHQRSHGQGEPETTTYFYSELTKELEAKYGYIPALHMEGLNRLDMHWEVANGLLPKFPAGSLPPKEEWYALPAPLHHRATW